MMISTSFRRLIFISVLVAMVASRLDAADSGDRLDDARVAILKHVICGLKWYPRTVYLSVERENPSEKVRRDIEGFGLSACGVSRVIGGCDQFGRPCDWLSREILVGFHVGRIRWINEDAGFADGGYAAGMEAAGENTYFVFRQDGIWYAVIAEQGSVA